MTDSDLLRELWRLLDEHRAPSELRAALLTLLRERETPTFDFAKPEPKKPVRPGDARGC